MAAMADQGIELELEPAPFPESPLVDLTYEDVIDLTLDDDVDDYKKEDKAISQCTDLRTADPFNSHVIKNEGFSDEDDELVETETRASFDNGSHSDKGDEIVKTGTKASFDSDSQSDKDDETIETETGVSFDTDSQSDKDDETIETETRASIDTDSQRSISYYNGNKNFPIYSTDKGGFSISEIGKVLVCQRVSKKIICHDQPRHVNKNVSFVVNLHSLNDPNDVKADDNGVWKRMGSPVVYVSVHQKGGVDHIYRRSKLGNFSSHYKVTRTYYKHSDSPDFNRMIVTIHNHCGELQPLAFVKYRFDRAEHAIEISSHGNSIKKKGPFSRTKASTLTLLKKGLENNPPVKVLQQVENIKGGVLAASSLCDLPRDRQQIHNLQYSKKHSLDSSDNRSPNSVPNDVLAEVMQICKDNEANNSKKFIRSVEAAPEPMCVLCTNQQLLDMERFCTKDDFTVISVDPTFNLGPFYVTPISYKNLLVEAGAAHHPIILGPVLIHQTKEFRPFHYFASTLVRLNPNLVDIKSFGTDGEPELIRAFKTVFRNAVHLRCVNHLRRNIKDKLNSLKLQAVMGEITSDIFGKQIANHFESGLIDSESPELFWKSLTRVRERWNNLEGSCNPSDSPKFYDWFQKYKAADLVNCAILSVRKQAGITRHYTTNNSESMNHVLKLEVDWKENKLPVLIQHIQNVVDRHQGEMEKAVVRRGEWKLSNEYRNLEVSEVSWFSMSQESRKRHLDKVLNMQLVSRSNNIRLSDATCLLEISVDHCGISSVPSSILCGIWNKATELLKSNNVIKVPWMVGKARFVKSSTSEQPHLVTASNFGYKCDNNCHMFKGYSICSHVLAAAQSNGDLAQFIQYFRSRRLGTCLSSIAQRNMPAGAGRKGGNAKRKRKAYTPVETRSVRPLIEQSSVDFMDEPGHSSSTTTLSGTPVTSQAELANASISHSLTSSSSYPLMNYVSTIGSSLPSTSQPITISCPISATGSNSINIMSSMLAPPSQAMASSNSLGNLPSIVSTSHILSPSTSPRNPHTPYNPSSPFVLKFLTQQIKVCQSCRKDYKIDNNTLGLVASRGERRLISNLATGTQFLGKESNSHYHLHMKCLIAADSSFTGQNLKIPESLKSKLTPTQKIYLMTCIGVPFNHL